MPLHSARPTNSEIFAQKARERAMEVLALRNEEFPGLMRTDPPKPTVASRLRKSRTLIIAVSIAVIVLIATTAATSGGSSSNKEAVANNLRTGEKNAIFMGEGLEESSKDESEDNSGTMTPTDEDSNESEDDDYCIDDPDYRYFGNEEHDCAWVADMHTANRCNHAKVMEHCRATCDPDCLGSNTFTPTETSTSTPTDPVEDDYVPGECTNNPNFRFEDVDEQDCHWVSLKFTSFRCSESGVLENCPAICDPDCKPTSVVIEESKVVPKAEASQPVSEPKAEEPQPVSEPKAEVSQPVSEPKEEEEEESQPVVSHVEFHQDGCTDNPNFRFEGEPDQDCHWVSLKFTSYRCSEDAVAVNCPAICDPDCGKTLPPTSTSTSPYTSDYTSDYTSSSTSEMITEDEAVVSV